MKDKQEILVTIDRYIIATLGMFLSAVGIAMTIISNLGTAPLSCPSYVLNLRWPGISIGMFTLIINCLYVLLQLLILRRAFKLEYLLQVVASALFGYMIDISIIAMDWMHPDSLLERIALTIISCFVSAFGISLEVVANKWMLSAEMTVKAIVYVTGRDFSSLKIAMDVTVVFVSSLLLMLFFKSPIAAGNNNVIGLGTLAGAILIGLFMKVTDVAVNRMILVRRRPLIK